MWHGGATRFRIRVFLSTSDPWVKPQDDVEPTTMTRIYTPGPLANQAQIELDNNAANHVSRVLRMRVGDQLILFDGQNIEYPSEIISIDKKSVIIKINHTKVVNRESQLQIHLYQGLCRGEKMDWVIQKSVELGVASITPILTEYGNVKLNGDRLDKKHEHWQKIIIGACEQSGRNQLPLISMPKKLVDTVAHLKQMPGLKIVCDPHTSQSLQSALPKSLKEAHVLVGPEGGFSQSEIDLLHQAGVASVSLGQRILRTETAPLSILSILQFCVDSI